jgi:hypothetical protein
MAGDAVTGARQVLAALHLRLLRLQAATEEPQCRKGDQTRNGRVADDGLDRLLKNPSGPRCRLSGMARATWRLACAQWSEP